MTDNLFLHAHLSKTAGQTFNNVLRTNFSSSLLMEYPMLAGVPFTKEHIRLYAELYNFRCVSSHNLRWVEVPYKEFPEFHTISFVRDPVRRTLSSYYYQRTRNDVRQDYCVNRYSLEKLIEMILAKDIEAPYTFNGQLKMLAGDKRLDKIRTLSETGHFCLFQTERFNEACVLLENLYPNDFKDCAFPKLANETPKYRKDNPDTIKIVEQLPYIEDDRMLHRFSGDYMDALIERFFENREAFDTKIKDFERRCHDKAKSFNHFLSEKKRWLSRKIKNTGWWKKI